MPSVTRRHTLRISLRAGLGLAGCALPLAACQGAAEGTGRGGSGGAGAGATKAHVMGTIHGRHRTSEAYSLDVLRAAILRADPDVILTEIPPDRVARALSSYRETGAVDEPRTRVFPEYTDVIIPLARPQGWRVVGTAGWTPAIARERRAALAAIREDPARAAQWEEHRTARRELAEAMRGRSDDPLFIHTSKFDRLVAASREPYARHFDADLGAGGWTAINAAHLAFINAALDAITGHGLNALITFGTAHKYKIRQSLAQRSDVALEDTRALFV
ncbi:MAG: hypothetical protein QNI87_01775 [Erythrobacter sp.]|uniref:hypothetical protein n=1 Tax=Erythrobacter sp. TaxID=1042 RepID=UPI002637306C|nr:hypothetical protein [Erythrobacter sp.]MDJ0977244.1 hypothetical protein [Erythrobacter sp.]